VRTCQTIAPFLCVYCVVQHHINIGELRGYASMKYTGLFVRRGCWWGGWSIEEPKSASQKIDPNMLSHWVGWVMTHFVVDVSSF
jgi:hypothetical protein